MASTKIVKVVPIYVISNGFIVIVIWSDSKIALIPELSGDMESMLNIRVPHLRFNAVSKDVSGAVIVADPLEKNSTDWALGVNVGGFMMLPVSHGLVIVTAMSKAAKKVVEPNVKVAIGETV